MIKLHLKVLFILFITLITPSTAYSALELLNTSPKVLIYNNNKYSYLFEINKYINASLLEQYLSSKLKKLNDSSIIIVLEIPAKTSKQEQIESFVNLDVINTYILTSNLAKDVYTYSYTNQHINTYKILVYTPIT